MSKRLICAKDYLPIQSTSRSRADKREKASGAPAAVRDASQFEFDADAWMALIAEQRLRIAAAAGVHPSKVRINLGH